MNDGGPAFPIVYDDEIRGKRRVSHGLSLRDYFAGQALNAMCELDNRGNLPNLDADLIASNSYAIADAMIKYRDTTPVYLKEEVKP